MVAPRCPSITPQPEHWCQDNVGSEVQLDSAGPGPIGAGGGGGGGEIDRVIACEIDPEIDREPRGGT